MCVNDSIHSPSDAGSQFHLPRRTEPAGNPPISPDVRTRQETLEERRERMALVMLLERHSELTQEELRAAATSSLRVLRIQVQMMRSLSGEGYWGDSIR